GPTKAPNANLLAGDHRSARTAQLAVQFDRARLGPCPDLAAMRPLVPEDRSGDARWSRLFGYVWSWLPDESLYGLDLPELLLPFRPHRCPQTEAPRNPTGEKGPKMSQVSASSEWS